MSKDFYNIAINCVDQQTGIAMIFVREEKGQLQIQPFSYAYFQGETNRFANGLKTVGLQSGERLLINLSNGPEFAIVFFGAMKAGVIPIPTSPLLTETEMEFILKDSGAHSLDLVWNKYVSETNSIFKTKPTFAHSPAFWLYTSGTEGYPKAVIHAHRSILAHDERVRVWQNLKKGDIVFNTSSLNWSYSLTCALMDIWRHGGTTVVYQGELKPEKIWNVIQKTGTTIFMSVPGIYRRLVEMFHHTAVRRSDTHLRACLSAGEKLDADIRRKFKTETGLEIYEGLGMTEHSVYLVQPYGEKIVEGSCGKPVPGSRIAILREDLTEAPPHETGILASHKTCPGLMLGDFTGEWFLSGDLAFRDEDGNYFYVGRRDDVITAGGYRISPMEVEAALNTHPAVLESAVVGHKIESGKTRIHAYVVLKKNRKSTPEEIIHHARSKLAKYKVPHLVSFVSHLQKTHNGKIKRQVLPV